MDKTKTKTRSKRIVLLINLNYLVYRVIQDRHELTIKD